MDSLALLKNMLNIYSPSYEEEEMAGFLVDYFQRAGFEAHIDDVGNAVGKVGEGDPAIILLGHMDTVKGFLKVREEKGRLYGRGSVDAKGPLAAFIAAAEAVKRELKKTVMVIAAVEEEVSSSVGAHHIVDLYRPDFAIVGEPSGWNGITLGYKGNLHINYIIREEKLHFSGRRSTSAEKGVEVWNDIKTFCEEYNQEKSLFDSLLPTLIALTSSDDDFNLELVGHVGVRLPPGFDVKKFKGWLESINNGAAVHYTGQEDAVKRDKKNRLVSTLLRNIRRQEGKPVFKYKTGTSDMNVIGPKWSCPIVAYGPGDSSFDHAPNEHILIDEFLRSIEVLKAVLTEL